MSDAYTFWGILSSAFFLLSIPAILHQLRLIKSRKKLRDKGQSIEATESISLNQVFSSYAGVYSFFLFGLVLDKPDPFLVYPRLIVGILLYLIIFEIRTERATLASKYILQICTFSFCVPILLVVLDIRAVTQTKIISNCIVCFATVLMAQGAYAQYKLLKKNQARGAVSLPMHAVLYLKDFTGMMFGFQLGFVAWSIIVMHGSNLLMRAPIIYYYLKLKRRS